MAVGLFFQIKIFSHQRKINIWFGLGGFLLVRKVFSKAARVAYSTDMLLKIKTVCLLDVIPVALLSNETLKIFL